MTLNCIFCGLIITVRPFRNTFYNILRLLIETTFIMNSIYFLKIYSVQVKLRNNNFIEFFELESLK